MMVNSNVEQLNKTEVVNEQIPSICQNSQEELKLVKLFEILIKMDKTIKVKNNSNTI
jgi:hypothetical protein